LAASSHHIIGVFANDIMVPLAPVFFRGFAQKARHPLFAGYFCLNE
jgi:hypothetical protein